MYERQKNKQELWCISPGYSWAEDRTKAEHRFRIRNLTANRSLFTGPLKNKNTY